jgi:hypothetical protein
MHARPENLNFWPRKTQLLTGRPVWRALVGDPCDSLILRLLQFVKRRVTPPSMDATKQSYQLMRFAVVLL